MMGVERVDGELAQRREHALAAERTHRQIGVDAVEGIEIDEAVGVGFQRAEADAFADEIGFDRLPLRPGAGDRRVALGAQIGRHLARQQFDDA